MRRWLPGKVGTAVIAVVLVATLLWTVPSGSYLFLPSEAEALEGRVEVEGATEDGDDPGGIYFVEIIFRKATLLERVAPPLRPDGATLVPAEVVVPPGTTIQDTRQRGRREMDRSQEVAAAVALEEAGYDVEATPDGVLVTSVASDVPAADVLDPTDVIVAAGGRTVNTPEQLRRAVAAREPGDLLALRIRDAGREREVEVELVADPRDPERAVIGIGIEQNADIELPVDVEIDLGRVGGPSAGLAFALEILEQLGRDVDGGKRVAATGERELDGRIVPIGGVKQKTFGAREAGVDVFLVPAGENAQDAERYAEGLEIVPVENFDQALRALATAVGKG